jgi:peroxiredoxin
LELRTLGMTGSFVLVVQFLQGDRAMGFTIDVGKPAPGFSLPGIDGKTWSLSDFADKKILVVMVTCNHCPCVVGSEERMKRFFNDYAPKGVGMVGINSNETEGHPQDSLEHMVARAKARGFSWPYLRDETQDVAKAYGAQRTPHFFVLDENRIVRYTGRMDDNPKNPGSETTHELRDAVDAVLAGEAVKVPVTAAIGCNVKWWGKDAHWMPNDACDFVPAKK